MTAAAAAEPGGIRQEFGQFVNELFDWMNQNTEAGTLFASLVFCGLSGLSEAETVIALRYGNPANGVGFIPPGPTGDRELLAMLQLEGATGDKRALTKAFIEAFTSAPKRVRAALAVSLAQLRRRIARHARLSCLVRSRIDTRPGSADAARAALRSRIRLATHPTHAP